MTDAAAGLAAPPDFDVRSRFSASMKALGPFERSPSLAAAVSGGSDSMSLAWLLCEWVKERGGRLTLLCVDHGLRVGSAADCAFVALAMGSMAGVSVKVLRWTGEHPQSGIQQAAREARYKLLSEWCRSRGVVHLCTGHTLDDQAETFAMRRDHGSGPAGLAGMAAIRPLSGVRLLRPLLGERREVLSRWLAAGGRGWREDPSNLSERFERVRHRHAIALSGKAGELAAEALGQGKRRDTLEHEAARLLAGAARIDGTGYAEVDTVAWNRHPAMVRVPALGALLVTIGGSRYRAAPDALGRLDGVIAGRTMARTLGGCVLQRRRSAILLCRETIPSLAAREGEGPWAGRWDNRFNVEIDEGRGQWSLKALGSNGLERLSRHHGMVLRRNPIPLAARMALPSLWRDGSLIAVPHLGWGEGLRARFCPQQSATGCGFPVADFGIWTI